MTSYIILFMFLCFAVWILLYLKRELPRRDAWVKENTLRELKEAETHLQNSTTYLTVNILAQNFNISNQKFYETLHSLKWVSKAKQKGWIATSLGKEKGAINKVYLGVPYVKWDANIKNDLELINAIEKLLKKPPKMTNREKKEKGDKYEAYIANFFKEQGYYVWEHGKEKKEKDKSIDLFIQKENEIYFVQCKNWENWKITDREVKATQTDVRTYLKENKKIWEFSKTSQMKILYVTAKECLTAGAYTYIKKNQNILEYRVIPMQE